MSADLMYRPVTELAALVRSGEVAARELVATSLEQIEAQNPKLNAFVDVFADDALAEAGGIGAGDARPFAGVPIAIKNNRAIAGRRLTCGCSLLENFIAPYDHNVVARLRAAGFVIVGTTALPEYGILNVTESRLLGPTRNPWDLDRTPGGSSGGSAAAVAAGMVPIAHGNDGGGSIRIPAACCGLVGLKSQRNRISNAPELGDSPLVTDGVLTRSVGDTAALLDLLAGYEVGDAAWTPPPPEPFAAAAARAPGRLRIAHTTVPPIADAEVNGIDAGGVRAAAELLAGLGHEVEEIDLPWHLADTQTLFGEYYGGFISLLIGWSAMAGAQREPREGDMEPMSWAIWRASSKISAQEFLFREVQLQQLTRALIALLEPYDALLTPVLAERPLPIGTLDTAAEDPMSAFVRAGYFTPFTPTFNASGQPAISLPLFGGEDGLPLAVQLVGRPAGEAALLALATQLEAAHPWADRRPPLSAHA